MSFLPTVSPEHAVAAAGAEEGVAVVIFGSVARRETHPGDVDVALIYGVGRRDAALALRERIRTSVHEQTELGTDFLILNSAEAPKALAALASVLRPIELTPAATSLLQWMDVRRLPEVCHGDADERADERASVGGVPGGDETAGWHVD